MKLSTEELAQRVLGECEALTIAMHAVLTLHPQRDAAAAKLNEGLQQMLARIEPKPYPQPFLDGLYFVRDRLLKPPEHPADRRTEPQQR